MEIRIKLTLMYQHGTVVKLVIPRVLTNTGIGTGAGNSRTIKAAIKSSGVTEVIPKSHSK